jgi:hypothetical protein
MALQGIISGFADPDNTTQHVILIGRGNGYTLVVNGLQVGEQEPTLDAGYATLANACDDKPKTWREVRGTTTSGETGVLTVTDIGPSMMSAFDLRVTM